MEYKREPLEEDEIIALRKSCQSFEEELIINLLLDTGMRVSELANLKEENINWQRNCITIIGKGKKRRIIPLSNLAKFYITQLFTKETKFPLAMRTIQKYVKVVAEKSKAISRKNKLS